jgi:hypothetical protein
MIGTTLFFYGYCKKCDWLPDEPEYDLNVCGEEQEISTGKVLSSARDIQHSLYVGILTNRNRLTPSPLAGALMW